MSKRRNWLMPGLGTGYREHYRRVIDEQVRSAAYCERVGDPNGAAGHLKRALIAERKLNELDAGKKRGR